MLRSGPKPEDLDFEIHVDQSCLNTPAHEAAEPEVMADDVPAAAAKADAEEVKTVEDTQEDVTDDTPEVVVEESKTESDDVKEDDKEEDTTEAEAAATEAVLEADTEDIPEKEPETTIEETAEAEETKPAAEDTSEEAETKIEEAEPTSEDTHTIKEDKPEATTAEVDSTPADEDSSANTDNKDTPEEEPSSIEAETETEAPEDTPAPAAEAETELEELVAEVEAELQAEPEVLVEAEDDVEETATPTEPEAQPEEESKEDTPLPEPELEAAEPEAEPEVQPEPEPEVEVEVEAEKESTPALETEAEDEEVERGRSLGPAAEITTSQLAEQVADSLNMAQTDSDETPTPAPAVEVAEDHDEPAGVQEASRSSSSLRRVSGRTDALIQAAAKEVLERLEAQTMETIRNRSHARHDSTGSTNNGTELHYDVSTRRESYNTDSRASRRESYNTESRASRRESYNTHSQTSRRESGTRHRPTHHEDGGDSSSQHGDSDVFSDRSPRSSLGSFDGNIDHHKDTSNRSSKRFSHMSDDVSVSEMSYYDKEDFVPTIRGAPRMPFRSPSDVRALQYSSPAPSVTGGSYSPRSSKRSQVPTISRLGSPNVSAQYSAKGRKTPTRFNPKKEPAPLVLLHVTLLPLRWQWAEILEQTSSETLSPEAKTLREAWHHLHDRVADTVCERGILLSHPQDEYEILEERLLEALDLPLRRRARVLECGHYLGPSNEMTLGEDMDSDEDEYDEESRRKSALPKMHWCQTCRHEIRYESLGPGKIFRIKVYASNGLMRTGAWAACWKEMERVDVEIEPIVESAVLDELERLVVAQSQQMSLVKHDPTILESTEGRDMPEERGMSDFDRDMPSMEEPMHETSHIEETHLLEPKYIESEAHIPASSPPPAATENIRPPSPEPMPRYDQSEERRLRDEARMREIYGHPPAPEPEHHEPAPESRPASSHHDAYSARSPPPSQKQQPEPEPQQPHYHEQHQHHQSPPPPEESYAQHHQRQQAFQNAGLAELLLEAARVFMQDKKNLAIVVMSLLVLFMAIRPAPREVKDWDGQFVDHAAAPVVEIPASQQAPPLMESIEAVVESVTASEASVEVVIQPTPEVEVVEPEPSVEAFVSESVASVVEIETTSTLATEQTSAVEQETSVTDSPSFSEEMRVPSPTPVHETITTRELVRIIETVTETVKAVVTETEVVRVQPTASVAPEIDEVEADEAIEDEVVADAPVAEEASETLVSENASETEEASAFETVSPVDEFTEDAVSDEEEAPATETALPVAEDGEHEVADELAQDVNDETDQMEEADENERDEL
ncbi:hypothetical protein HER10_EVM0006778 [Colletotrichum scovillei]|uniref:Pathway-specific nitrogen regulator n=1 Tax=Colletotrichum scovillei TaxID=1209932 RepID=A0A9P7R9L6_9PEZI|nr:uncharacterized protein HER10_EVM0006778 [Colletotrichum scovillei]KAF4776521.1 hypothetical protein HER10_EVM0006778 [Colletotrichum scovillei]KAG7053373.1 pathway-specific nitrogen regulator [Colletotrichum scovillei]KAG7071667.1 pathway-specific nitrogen regulator [Colletotrichum scovillei]KAG7079915.1 pathway-specific nitrogen regulator [Colletotrichum scovillei]